VIAYICPQEFCPNECRDYFKLLPICHLCVYTPSLGKFLHLVLPLTVLYFPRTHEVVPDNVGSNNEMFSEQSIFDVIFKTKHTSNLTGVVTSAGIRGPDQSSVKTTNTKNREMKYGGTDMSRSIIEYPPDPTRL
jgi:hypothetical protein